MADARDVSHLKQTFREAEQAGLRLAIKGRVVVVGLIGLWFIVTRSGDPSRSLDFALAFGAFLALGGLHYLLIGSRFDRAWVKYLFISIDILLFSAMMATQPVYEGVDIPQSMAFRMPFFPYYFLIIGIAAFSFSPGMVLWAGLAGAGGWLGAFAFAVHGMENTLDWSDIGSIPTTERFLTVWFDVNFIGTGSRIQEALAFLAVAILIAIVMVRARRTVRRQLELDEERRTITEVFGQYVPPAITQALIDGAGVLQPVERQATVLFADLAGFTTLTEREGAQRIVRVLNAYFDDVTRIIGDNDGVITQFQGDAVLATFNLPLEDPDHAAKAIKTARQIQSLVRAETFDGLTLRARVGICTGPVVAGSVGGGGRQNYTVHGDTVNLAARLEAANKDHGTDVLVGEQTVRLLAGEAGGEASGRTGGDAGFRRIGEIDVRGLSEPVAIYTLD